MNQKSKMNKYMKSIAGMLTTAVVLLCACKAEEDVLTGPNPMTMTTSKSGEAAIHLIGDGTATISWGNGANITKAINDDSLTLFTHTYTNTNLHNITISGSNITDLRCPVNQLTSLDVSKNTALTGLWCFDNQLTNLDVSKNTALSFLNFSVNQLTSLDVSTNTALSFLICANNQLTSLDVSTNTALTVLYCQNNQLTSLDVSTNTALAVLYCQNNQLTKTALDALFETLYTPRWAAYAERLSGNPPTI